MGEVDALIVQTAARETGAAHLGQCVRAGSAATARGTGRAGTPPTVAAIPLPPPLALARPTDTLDPPGVRGRVLAYEPKWDGFRAVVHQGRIWSRHHRELTRYFPDLSPALAAVLPGGLVLDGEVVCWDHAASRLDFAALSRRLTAGRALASWAAQHPAQLVAFDVLADDDADLRPLPLADRRRHLAAAAMGLGPAGTLCPQTLDVAEAEVWMSDYLPAHLEGLVLKRVDQPYVAERIWWKYRVRWPVDLVILGVTGPMAAPSALLLGAVESGRGLVPVGASTRLRRAEAREIGRVLVPTGRARPRRLACLPGAGEPVLVRPVVPVAAEFLVDGAIESGQLRHPARFLRLRPELEPATVVIGAVSVQRGGGASTFVSVRWMRSWASARGIPAFVQRSPAASVVHRRGSSHPAGWVGSMLPSSWPRRMTAFSSGIESAHRSSSMIGGSVNTRLRTPCNANSSEASRSSALAPSPRSRPARPKASSTRATPWRRTASSSVARSVKCRCSVVRPTPSRSASALNDIAGSVARAATIRSSRASLARAVIPVGSTAAQYID